MFYFIPDIMMLLAMLAISYITMHIVRFSLFFRRLRVLRDFLALGSAIAWNSSEGVAQEPRVRADRT